MPFFKNFAAAGLMLGWLATGASAAVITNLAGDKDSFGTGKALGSTVSVAEINATTPGVGDGDFDQWSLDLFTWTHAFDLTGQTIVEAMLTVVTLDMEDNGAGDGRGGAPFDDLLSIDGTDIPGAFDNVFTPDATGTMQIAPNVTIFDLGAYIAQLSDGSATFVLNPLGGSDKDAIAVDYAELRLETRMTPVPLPAGLPLLLVGLGGFALFKRRTAPKPV